MWQEWGNTHSHILYSRTVNNLTVAKFSNEDLWIRALEASATIWLDNQLFSKFDSASQCVKWVGPRLSDAYIKPQYHQLQKANLTVDLGYDG